jgi:hypothetical protein
VGLIVLIGVLMASGLLVTILMPPEPTVVGKLGAGVEAAASCVGGGAGAVTGTGTAITCVRV